MQTKKRQKSVKSEGVKAKVCLLVGWVSEISPPCLKTYTTQLHTHKHTHALVESAPQTHTVVTVVVENERVGVSVALTHSSRTLYLSLPEVRWVWVGSTSSNTKRIDKYGQIECTRPRSLRRSHHRPRLFLLVGMHARRQERSPPQGERLSYLHTYMTTNEYRKEPFGSDIHIYIYVYVCTRYMRTWKPLAHTPRTYLRSRSIHMYMTCS